MFVKLRFEIMKTLRIFNKDVMRLLSTNRWHKLKDTKSIAKVFVAKINKEV